MLIGKRLQVVYGLLDQAKDQQFIKVNKAFLGSGDAMLMANIADSINYNPEDLEVSLIRIGSSSVLDTIILDTTIIEKDDGLFSTDNNIIYTLNSSIFLQEDQLYQLDVRNLVTGTITQGMTLLIDPLNVEDFWNDFPPSNPYKFNFFHNQEYQDLSFSWHSSDNAVIYQMSLIFNYIREGVNKDTLSLAWLFPVIHHESNTQVTQEVKGDQFFNFLKNNVELQQEFNENSLSTRKALSLNLTYHSRWTRLVYVYDLK